MSTNAIKNNTNEEWCLLSEVMWFEACLPPHAYLNSGLPGLSASIMQCLLLAFDFLLSAFLNSKWVFFLFVLLAQDPPMSVASSSYPIGIFVPTLQSPQSSWVQHGMKLSRCCTQYTHSTRCKSPRCTYLPSFTGQTGSISSPAFSFT